MNKKIITTGKAVLSTVMASTMVCSMLPMNIYAQGTEEPVIVEENNVSDPNQEKEDEPQASEQEQPEEETVQSEESVDDNVQNTEPQSEEETVETEQTQSTLGARATAPDVVFDVGEEYEKVNIVNPTADSVETSGENGAVANAFDGNQQTVWHTLWSSDGQKQMPHWISYELAEPTTIGRIDYVGKPGQNGVGNGVFKSVNIYVSTNAGQDPSTNEGWTKVGTYNGITYNPSTGVDTNRSHTFTFTPTLAAKVKIEITESYSSGSGTEPENQYANALELITYAYKAQPEDTLPITVSIDGKSYTGDSIQAIVEDNSISKNNVKKFSITGGTIEYADLEYLGNGSSFLFREIKELTIDLTKATMLNEAGEKTTELPSSIFGSMKKLEKLSLPGVTKIGAGVFKQAGNNNGITSLNLPDVVELGTNAFDGAAFKLREINLPKAQIIGQSAMRGNYKYSNVVFHLDSVVRIGDNAFDNTSRHTPYIQELTLPETLEELGHNCFLIKEDGTITLEGETSPKTPEVSGWYPFGDENFTLKVPNDSYKAEDFGKEGQVTLIPAKVSDTEVPEVKVTYSNKNGSQVTKEDVTVTLTANEDIQDIEGWTRVDSKTLQKVHSENGKFNVTVKDLAGNETKVKYEVKRIDKVAPVIEGVKDGEVTNKDVEFTVKEQSISKIIIDEKEYNEKNAPKKVSGEGKHTIKVVDKAGNETSVSFTIDQTAPKFIVKEESKGYDGVYSKLSLKLYDAHKVDYVEINGKKKDLSDNQWSDLNDQNAGYKEGKNTVVLYDVAGNSAEFTFIYDKTGPTVTVKDSSVEKDGYYSRLDLKLYDANNVDYAEINGKRFELTNNQWSDINHANAGYVDGENTIVVYDQAGNSTTVKFMIGEPVKADKTALQEKIDEAKKLEEDNYTEETWSKLEEVLEAAEKVNDNEKATQEEVDKAVADLDAAIKGLEEVVINITANVNGTPVSGETLEDAVTKAGIEQDDVDTVELLTGTITQADLDYLKGSRVTELTINLDADLKMADGSTKMPGSQFQNSRLEKLTLGGFTEIGSRAFVQSTSLKEVSLPDVVTVGKEAFYRCDDYTDVTLPASIQSIGDSAFAEAANGKRELNVVFQGTTPPELGNRPFGSLGTVTVPEGSLTAYLPELDITKTFRDSGTNKFGNLDVIDPAYQKVKFQYGQYGSNAFYAYYKKGAALNTVEIQDIPSSSIPEGKEFAGWNTKKDGSGATIADTDAVPADVEVLYPVYEDVVVNITINIDGKEISGETLQAAVEEAGLTTGLINKVEFVSGKVTKADLEYIAKYADELVFKLSDTLTYVGDNDTATTVFPNTSQNWSQLESLTLEGFTEIAASAFYNHEDLRTVNLTGVEIIGGSAFNVSKNASKKEMNVTISDSIKEIGSKAFYGQNNRPLNLTLNVKDPSTITLNKNAFDGINTSLSKVNVPEGSLQNYLINLDITKAFNSSTNTKWNKMIVNDPAYQLMTFQYDADYEGVTFNAYIKNGSTLSSISLEDVQTAINNRIPEGYAFAGWNTAVDGTGTDITDETVFPIEAERIYIKLAVAADKTKLQEQIDAAKKLEESSYTEETWSKLEEALKAAEEVNADQAATQDEVDKAASDLEAAIKGLELFEPADKTALQKQIEEAEDRNENYYTADTWTKLQEALTSAKAVNDNDSASQTEVDEATSALEAALKALVYEVEGEIYLIIGDEKIPLINLTNTADQSYWEDPYVYDKPLSSNPMIRIEGKDIYEVTVRKDGSSSFSTWKGNASDHVSVKEWDLFNSSNNGNGTYKLTVGVDKKIFRIAIEVTNYTSPSTEALKAALDEAKAIEKGNYTDESFEALQEAIKKSDSTYNAAVKNLWDADQAELDNATKRVEDAIAALEVNSTDKTKLQSLVDEVKDYNAEGVTGFDVFQDQLKLAQDVLADPEATQEDIDKRVIQLEGRYYIVQLKALNAKYKDTISGKSSVIYTTDSMKALVEMYEGVKDKSFSASKVLKQTDVDTAKAKLEEYQKLEKELVKASASDATVGINESALARSANKGQGTFEILSKTAVEGGYELTIKFTNDAMHPIFGESYTNYDGTETKFAKFGGTADAKMYVDAYDSSFGAISRPWTSNTSFEALEGNTSKTPGFTTKITVPENTAYVTLSYTYSGATAHSAGYWVVGNIQEVVEVDKTALKEAIDEADAALQLVKSDEVTVSDGETQMDKIFPDARELYENPDATQEQVDQMTEDLVAATQYMKEHETWIEILSVGSVENNSISLICNNIPYKTLDGKHKGVALFGDYAKGEAGTNSSLKWDRTRDGSTDYTVINNLEDGENFFYIRFKGYFADEYQDTYWVYVNTTTKEADFGKVGDAVDPSAVVKAGDQDISVSDKEQTISVQDGEKAKLVVTGEDIGYATVTKDGKVVEQTLFPLLNHKTLEVDASEAGEYQVKVVYNWNGYKVSGGNGVYVYDKEVTYNFTIEEAPDVNKTELQSLYDEVKGKTSENSFFKYFSETLEESKNVLEDPDATQEEIDKQVIKLNTRYYGLLVGELNDEYNPEKKDYSLYSTESVVPVANIWQITRYRVNNNYQESETQGNIGQMKGWYEQYLEAIEGLTSADDTSLKVGINKDALRTSEDQGHFEVVSKSPTSDGKYEVTVHFINDGIHPVYGEELPNASGSTEFDKMSLSNSSKVRIRTFKEGFASYQTKYASEVGKLPGQTSISKGLEAKFILDADEVYFTLEAVEGRNSSFSEGYFVVKNIVEEEVEPADKTALGEAVESARLALAAVDLKQTTVTDGYDELKELYTKALTLSEDENATQKEVDAMVKELTDAEAYMQSNEAQREMLEIVSQDESTLTFKTNYFPYGVYAYHVDSGQSKTITFTQSKADSTVTAHGLKEGENFFYLQFTNRWTKSQNMYWVYVDTTKNVSDFGKLTDAVQSDLVAIVHVGDKDYPVKTTSASQTIIEVPKGTDEVTVTIQGVDLGYAEVKNKDEGIPQERIYPPYDSDHKSITFKLTDSEGNLAEGPYQALIKYNFRAWEPVTGQTLYKTTAYREFTIKFVEPSTDKTELQSFYDKVKDLQSDVSSFKYFTTQLKAAKNVLDNPQATQDEIDLAIINLEAKYYAVKVAELNVKYNPENDFNFTEYTTESLVPVMNMWGITHNRSNGNYFEDSERGDVGQMKGWYEEYTKAIEGLKEATDESVYIGITSESTKSDDEQGSFEVVSAEKVIVDGQEKVKLVVNYNNTGIHPIYGESLLNANGTKKFRKITSMSEKISFRYEAYNSEMKHQISAGMSDKTKLPDATNWSAGMQGVCYLDPSINYVTFVINNELYSSWIYRIPELSSPVDKSDLQSLIEETKNYQSDDSYYDEFQEALTNAQNVLSNEEATQEEVDEAHENLELYYYRSHAYALALKYKPVGAASGKYDGTFDYAKYEVGGALKVINAYYGVMNLGAYPKVADVKTAYEILKAAIPELKEITGEPRSMLVGPNEDLIELTESRGYFTFEESPAENGMINLHIVYVNNGINPINGKDFGEFEGRKFTALKSTLRLQCQTYKGAGKIIDFKDDITLMGGNEATSVDGFEVDVVVEPGRYNVYMELEGVEVYSQGYYYTSESAATGSETSAAKDEVSSDENQSVDSSQETEESTNPFLSFLDSIIQFFKDLF